MKAIKYLFAFGLLALASFAIASNSGIDFTSVIGGVITAGSLAMAGISVTDVQTEFGSYYRTQNQEIRDMVYNKSQSQKYMRTITKVKGKYPVIHSVTDRVIQGFSTTWNAKGTTEFVPNELTAYHQKVNFPIVPATVLNSWLAYLYQENVSKEQMPISKYIMEKVLKPAVERDVEYLIGNGDYDANDLTTFGKSMDGLKVILADGLASSTKPMYKMPLAALTSNGSNAVARVEAFEDQIPNSVRGLIDKIYMSQAQLDKYKRNYRDTYGAQTDFSKDQLTTTYVGNRELVGLTCLNGSDIIFATPDENFLKLIDAFDNPPEINDVQVADYTVKIFMEFHLGVGFAINQLVLASVSSGSGSGLTTDNDTYYSA